MNSVTNTSDAGGCVCVQPHGINRRHFLKSILPGALALYILQSAQPAKAENHSAQALVLSCSDFRFLKSELSFLAEKYLGNQYDWTALAGASLALAEFPHPADTVAFWDQLDLSYRLHHINKVIILDHQDCGAYASIIDWDLSEYPERELQVHADYLNQAYWAIRDRYPDLSIELYFVTLNGSVKAVFPMPQN